MAKGKLEKAVAGRSPPPARKDPATQQEIFEFLVLILKAIKRSASKNKKEDIQALRSTIATFARYAADAKKLNQYQKALERLNRAKVPPRVIRDLREAAPVLGRAPTSKDLKVWRPLLDNPDFQATRLTGAIKEMRAIEFPDRSVQFTIGGYVLPSITAIRKPPPRSATGVMDYSTSMRSATGLTYGGKPIDGYHRAHLWGHGFGDEARLGLMYAPEELNQEIQRIGLEAFIIRQAEIAARDGGTVKLIVTARSHPPLPPSNLRPKKGELLLAEITYEVAHLRKDGTQLVMRKTFTVPPPPGHPIVIDSSPDDVFDPELAP